MSEAVPLYTENQTQPLLNEGSADETPLLIIDEDKAELIEVAYDYDLFDDTNASLLEFYKCGICHNVSRMPYNLRCAHLFCGACLRQHQALKKSEHIQDEEALLIHMCPVCKQTVRDVDTDPQALMLNMHVKQIVESTSMCCPHRSSGCDKRVVIGIDERNLQAHLRECGWVICADCQDSVKRTDLDEHATNTCKRRRVVCQFCGVTYHAPDLEMHLAEKIVVEGVPIEQLVYRCASAVDCTNGCSAIIPTAELTDHKFVCPSEVLPCEFGERHLVTCTEHIQRGHMLAHLREHIQGNLVSKVRALETQQQQAMQSIQKLERRLARQSHVKIQPSNETTRMVGAGADAGDGSGTGANSAATHFYIDQGDAQISITVNVVATNATTSGSATARVSVPKRARSVEEGAELSPTAKRLALRQVEGAKTSLEQ